MKFFQASGDSIIIKPNNQKGTRVFVTRSKEIRLGLMGATWSIREINRNSWKEISATKAFSLLTK
jgi:hypothetical protein